MSETAFLLLGLALFGFALISRTAERSAVSAPMVFTLLGLAFGLTHDAVEGPAGNFAVLRVLAEVALGLTLFIDAAAIPSRRLWRAAVLPARLLGIGLPLVIAMGTAAALAIWPHWGFLTALLLALILAPTDAVLAQPIFKDKNVPTAVRDSINAESGLNDGMVLPAFLCTLALVISGLDEQHWLDLLLWPLVLAPIVGVPVGYVGTRLLHYCAKRDWMGETYQRLSALALALIAFAGAEMIGGNGFVATFTAGLATSATCWRVGRRFEHFGEAESRLLALLMFALFGAVILPSALAALDWRIVVYAAASLLVLRPVAVGLSLIASRLTWRERLFVGWFGPRGAASVLYLIIGVEGLGISLSDPLVASAGLAILSSVVLHGFSAVPASAWLAATADRQATRKSGRPRGSGPTANRREKAQDG